jgi:hypothetical protein
MEEDLAKLLQGLQALTEGDGPTLDAFVSRDAAELLRERGTAPISEDDRVRYEVHPLDSTDIDQLQNTVSKQMNAWSGSHAWRDAGAPCASLQKCKAHLEASITISDLDDEWLLVSLLADLTRMERVACRVTDSDGEFLLVDAADELPDWLEPESAVGRTWLVDGEVAVVLHEPGGPLPLQKGLGLCASSRDNAASIEATAALRRREQSLKEGAQTCVLGRRQNVVVAMPSHAWRVFRRAPRLVGPAAAKAPRRAPSSKSTTEGIVRLSKASYARLSASTDDIGAALAAGLEVLRKSPSARERELLASDTVQPEETQVDDPSWLQVDQETLERKCREAATPNDVVAGVHDFLEEDNEEEPMAPVAVDGATVAALLRGEAAPARPPDAEVMDVLRGLRDAAGAPAAAVAAEGPDSDDEVEGDDVYAAQLEAELATTEMAQSFDRPENDDAPVDVDFNLVKNLLESVEAQDGAGPGAAALLLNELGLELPADD